MKKSTLKERVRENFEEKFGYMKEKRGFIDLSPQYEEFSVFLDSVIDRAKAEVVEYIKEHGYSHTITGTNGLRTSREQYYHNLTDKILEDALHNDS